MNIRFEQDRKFWKAYSPILGVNSRINLCGLDLRPGLTKEKAVEDILSRVNENIKRIEELLLTFCNFYNENWSDPEDGYPILSENEFMEKLKLDGIYYDIEDESHDALFLYFSESGLFGGHAIEIFWQSSDEMSADIVG